MNPLSKSRFVFTSIMLQRIPSCSTSRVVAEFEYTTHIMRMIGHKYIINISIY